MLRRHAPLRLSGPSRGPRLGFRAVLGVPLLLVACAYDWDAVDPRLAETRSPDGSGGGSSAIAGASSGGSTGSSGATSAGGVGMRRLL